MTTQIKAPKTMTLVVTDGDWERALRATIADLRPNGGLHALDGIAVCGDGKVFSIEDMEDRHTAREVEIVNGNRAVRSDFGAMFTVPKSDTENETMESRLRRHNRSSKLHPVKAFAMAVNGWKAQAI